LSDVRHTWLVDRLTVGLAALLALGFALASMREPVAPIGAGVQFYPESVPAGSAVIDEDERMDLELGGAHSRHRVQALESRLRESEEQRVKAEGELQRALSMLASSSSLPEAVIPRPSAKPAERPAVTIVPDMDSSSTPESTGEDPPPATRRRSPSSRAAASAEETQPNLVAPTTKPRSKTTKPRRKPGSDLTPVPAPARTVRTSHDRILEPEPVTDPERVPLAAPEPIVASPDPVVIRPEVPEQERQPNVAAVPHVDEPGRRPLPDAEVFVLPDRPSPGRADDEDPAHVLERLVEPVGTHATSEVDPSVIRSRLARTAALKKPGGRAREHRFRSADPPEDPPA
jgi:hypothetical protein